MPADTNGFATKGSTGSFPPETSAHQVHSSVLNTKPKPLLVLMHSIIIFDPFLLKKKANLISLASGGLLLSWHLAVFK